MHYKIVLHHLSCDFSSVSPLFTLIVLKKFYNRNWSSPHSCTQCTCTTITVVPKVESMHTVCSFPNLLSNSTCSGVCNANTKILSARLLHSGGCVIPCDLYSITGFELGLTAFL